MAATRRRPLLGYIEKLSGGPCEPPATDRQLLDDFSARHDETAFSELVARHGPLVLRVCRRVLHHEQDAEDAFQATFLVLARCSESIRKREALANWLHGVAYRTAMKAKRSAARRRDHETRLREQTSPNTANPTWDDVQAVLDEEIQRLPASSRSAFVLCVLEGKTTAAVAAELGCKEGTVASRLSRARQRLQQQLSRRGIELAALLAAVCVAEGVGKAALPAALAENVIRSGVLTASGGAAAGVVSPHVTALATGVARAMFLQKAKIATIVLLAISLFASGGGMLIHQVLAGREQPGGNQKSAVKSPEPLAAKKTQKPPDVEAKPPAVADKDAIVFAGRVLGPDGKPVASAKLYLTPTSGYLHQVYESHEVAVAGADGRFQFTAPKAEFGDYATVAAAAANYGVGWVTLPAEGKRDDLTLRLVDDSVPIAGQIIDLEGKPVPGSTLRVLQVNAAPNEDLGPWLEAAQANKSPGTNQTFQLENQYLNRYTIAPSPKFTTDADGRFRLTGIGRNRLVRVQLDGPTIASERICALTRPGKAIKLTQREARPEFGDSGRVITYHGANVRYAAAPTKPIVGVVLDKDTKKPLPGVTVQSEKLATSRIEGGVNLVQTTTDAQGRYRLIGMPKGDGNVLLVVPTSDQPYPVRTQGVPDSPGLDPVTLDIELKRGIWIEGKITDKVTGKPLKGRASYSTLETNPNLKDYPGFGAYIQQAGNGSEGNKEDGSYRVLGLPGPGLVVVWRMPNYLLVTERDDEDGVQKTTPSVGPFGMPLDNYGALARIDPAKGVAAAKRDVTLDPGWTFTGTVLGPDGKPLVGVRSFGAIGQPKETAEFTVSAFNQRRPRDLFFRHLEKGLVGVAEPPKENGGSVTVRMVPGTTVTGRLVNAFGEPRPGVVMKAYFRLNTQVSHWPFNRFTNERIETDKDGRFRIEAMLVGHRFRLSNDRGELDFVSPQRSGETKDLGDVRLKGD